MGGDLPRITALAILAPKLKYTHAAAHHRPHRAEELSRQAGFITAELVGSADENIDDGLDPSAHFIGGAH